MNFIAIETTYPNLEEAKKLAKILLNKKLAACVHFNTISSFYSWQGNIENSQEILLSIKTTADFFDEISTLIKENHSYQIPQIIAKKIDFLSQDYANWVSNSLNKN